MSGIMKSITSAGKVKKAKLPTGEPVEPDAPGAIDKPIIMPSLSNPAMLQEARQRAAKRSRRGRRGTILSGGASAYQNRTLGGTS